MTKRMAGAPEEKYPLPLTELATIVHGNLSEEDEKFIEKIEKINWNKHHLNLSHERDIKFAAHALSFGIPVFHGFGNFYALTFYPHPEVIRSVNAAKGRPLEQIASITTTKEHLAELFDWEKLPFGFSRNQIMSMMNAFFEMGPFGFRGPAAISVDKHLTKEIESKRTIQVIAAGYHCPSNELLTEALKETGISYFAATSPNISSNVTGAEEPAHFRIKGIKRDFGSKKPGFIMVAHQSEREAKKRHPIHDSMSTSIISFDREYPLQDGKPVVTIERHGSLGMPQITSILERLGIGYVLGSNAMQRLSMRKYPLIHRFLGRV
jgi:hypothetical protein